MGILLIFRNPTAYSIAADAGTFTLTGEAAGTTSARTLACATGSFIITGEAAALMASRTLAAAHASFALTGENAGVAAQRLMAAGAASFVLTGETAALTAGRTASAGAGSFVLTGEPASTTSGTTVAAGNGSFAVSGQDAGLVVSALLSAGATTFALTGEAAGTIGARTTSAALGSFVLTGERATIAPGRTIAAGRGSFVLTGEQVGAAVARELASGSGGFALSGQAAGTVARRNVSSGNGSFSLAGQGASLLAAREAVDSRGSFALTGKNAGLLRRAVLSAATGSFSVSGKTAALRRRAVLSSGTGHFAVTGEDAGLDVTEGGDKTIAAGTGSFLLSGQDAELTLKQKSAGGSGASRRRGNVSAMAAQPGRLEATGEPAAFRVDAGTRSVKDSVAAEGQASSVTGGVPKVTLLVQADGGVAKAIGTEAELLVSADGFQANPGNVWVRQLPAEAAVRTGIKAEHGEVNHTEAVAEIQGTTPIETAVATLALDAEAGALAVETGQVRGMLRVAVEAAAGDVTPPVTNGLLSSLPADAAAGAVRFALTAGTGAFAADGAESLLAVGKGGLPEQVPTTAGTVAEPPGPLDILSSPLPTEPLATPALGKVPDVALAVDAGITIVDVTAVSIARLAKLRDEEELLLLLAA